MIRLRTLGALALRGSGDEELRAVLAQPRRAALLAYLALATPRGYHLREKLLALFWPELDSDHARNALGQALHFLRRSLGANAIVNRNGDALGLDWEGFWCDAVAFEEGLDAGRVAEAVGLYRGDLLDGFHIGDAAEFERWLDGERARLAARYTKAVESLAADREAAADYQAAVALWQLLASRDPYSSRLTLGLMRALAVSGDPAAAMLQARQHERLVREELGIAPDAEVAALVRQLQARQSGDATRPAILPAMLPAIPSAVETPIDGVGAAKVATGSKPVGEHAGSRSRHVAILAAAVVMVCVGVGVALARTDRHDSVQRDVRDLYARGRQSELNRSLVGVQTAAEYYRRAIERDSTFAPAYAGLSGAYVHMAHYDFAPKLAALDSARILAQRAVALDSTLSETRTALAVSLANSGHFAAAEREFRSAIELDPRNSRAHLWYAMLLVALGRGQEANAEAERVLELDPVPPRSAESTKQFAQYLITGKRPAMKLPTAERRPILKTEMGEPWARAQQAVELADESRCDEARSDILRAQGLVPDSNMVMLAFAGLVDWSCGARANARKVLTQMKRRADPNDHALRVAMLHTRLGDTDSAFVWLARHRWMVSELLMLSAGEYVDPLRSDPKFPELMRRLGIR